MKHHIHPVLVNPVHSFVVFKVWPSLRVKIGLNVKDKEKVTLMMEAHNLKLGRIWNDMF